MSRARFKKAWMWRELAEVKGFVALCGLPYILFPLRDEQRLHGVWRDRDLQHSL